MDLTQSSKETKGHVSANNALSDANRTSLSFLCFGGAHIDQRAKATEKLESGGSTPGACDEDFGGAIFNTARTLTRLGQAVTLVSACGADDAGRAVAQEAQRLGIHAQPLQIDDAKTARYLAVLTQDGRLVAAIADMAIYEQITPAQIAQAWGSASSPRPSAVITDANLPMDAIKTLAGLCRETNISLYGLGVSASKISRFSSCLGQLSGLSMNLAEAQALTGKIDPQDAARDLIKRGLRSGFITDGGNLCYAWQGDERVCTTPPRLYHMMDVTGAGDAFAAQAFISLQRQESLIEALKLSIAAAQITLQSAYAAAPDLTVEAVHKAASNIKAETWTL